MANKGFLDKLVMPLNDAIEDRDLCLINSMIFFIGENFQKNDIRSLTLVSDNIQISNITKQNIQIIDYSSENNQNKLIMSNSKDKEPNVFENKSNIPLTGKTNDFSNQPFIAQGNTNANRMKNVQGQIFDEKSTNIKDSKYDLKFRII